ncbi:hypothetical protein TSUD_177240 [Trifolium subterraneum]|uniref:DUF674 family protein n=1 Tax=Trifolium subterraneum TaxID=3900 RepID=A0A2Z6PR19_TRISU|nr:hypothetical protein TSUD_177240 [Trifolium subterraneum]
MISKEAKNRLVDPCIAPQFKLSKQILTILDPDVIQYYCCENGKDISVQFCKAGEDMRYEGYRRRINFTNYPAIHEGYVKGPAMYVATDDLVVTRLSPISALGLLNRFQTPLNDLNEKVVTIGIKEALSILNAGLTSTSALTNGLAHLLTDVKEEK